MFHRFVGGTVLPDGDAVMGEHVNDGKTHQGGEPDRRAQVVGKDEEGTAVGTETAVKHHAVQGRAHGVFPHAEPDIPPV